MTDWLQHTLDRSRWRPQRQVIALMTLGLFVAIIIGALYLSQSASSSALGRQLEDMLAQRDELQQENERLRSEIAVYQSMPRLQGRAVDLGFTPATADEIEYLVIEGYNPNTAAAVVEVEPEPEPLPVYDETLTGWIEQQWDALLAQIDAFTQGQTEAGQTP